LKQTFHPQCFLCAQCGAPIGTGSFHIEDGKVYCERGMYLTEQTINMGETLQYFETGRKFGVSEKYVEIT